MLPMASADTALHMQVRMDGGIGRAPAPPAPPSDAATGTRLDAATAPGPGTARDAGGIGILRDDGGLR
jgi:hypothetical protein